MTDWNRILPPPPSKEAARDADLVAEVVADLKKSGKLDAAPRASEPATVEKAPARRVYDETPEVAAAADSYVENF
jgi:hypothetical protein